MNNKPLLVSLAAFGLAVALAFLAALGLVALVEGRTASALADAFEDAGITWVSATPDGLQVHLSGTAPDESARIQAIRAAGAVVDASRISETINVPQTISNVAPVFRIEVMRNRAALSVIGLVPAVQDGGPIIERLQGAAPGLEVADMLQSSDHAVPVGWVPAVDFAVQALREFSIGRISVTSGRIEVEALVDSQEAKEQLEATLREIAPRNAVLALDLTAPRPVVAPFLLRVEYDDEGVLRLRSCAADSQAAQDSISAALVAAGFERRIQCPLALGAPSPRWGEAGAAAIAALAELGKGQVTLSDGDVSLVAPHDVEQAAFDLVAARLEARLPNAFSLSALRLDPPEAAQTGAPTRTEMSMTLDEEGRVVISGRLPDARIRAAVAAFASARFGEDAVEVAARIDENLSQGWSTRVLTALDALTELHHGRVVVTDESVSLSGVSGNPDAGTQVTEALVQGLGAASDIQVDVTYDEALDPVQQAPTPDNCEARIHAILEEDKITFDPGSTEINEAAGRVIDRIADVLRECGELPFEVAGHTDSQGREETNLNLSQNRAEAVINALLARRVLVSSLQAQGYGAANPIADNGTEEGREANRRIEFNLIRPEPEPEPLDPALEAQLVFEIQAPDRNTVRPRQRPQPPQEAEPAETAPAEDGN